MKANERIYTAGLMLALSCITVGDVVAGPIYQLFEDLPADLKTAVSARTPKEYRRFTTIGCFDVNNGSFLDCHFEMKILGMKSPIQDSENNGGHHHDFATHPLGSLIWKNTETQSVSGQTAGDWAFVYHKLPAVSSKIETQLDLYVPPGWYCVYPECLDATRSGWRWLSTLDIKVPDLMQLPGQAGGVPIPGESYVKARNPDSAHLDDDAFAGTAGTIDQLKKVANAYKQSSGSALKVNDMSLPSGGLFDWKAKMGQSIWSSPHSLHRTGESVDINKADGDCLDNEDLLDAVDTVMPLPEKSVFRNPSRYYKSRLLCETWNGNAIHIDFDPE